MKFQIELISLLLIILLQSSQNECSIIKLMNSTLFQINQTNTIRLGVYRYGFPFSYYDEEAKKYIGFSMDICQIIVNNVKDKLKMSKLKIEYVEVDFSSRFDKLLNNDYDLECYGSTNTKLRQLLVEFSFTSFVDEIKMLVKTNSKITSLNQLKGLTVATMADTTVADVIANYQKTNALIDVILTNTADEAFSLVESGQVAAWIYDVSVLALYRASSTNPNDFTIVGDVLAYDPISVFFRKDDPKFTFVVDEAVLKIIKTGLISKLHEKWFQSPISPNQINLQLIPSDSTQLSWTDPHKIPSEAYPLIRNANFIPSF